MPLADPEGTQEQDMFFSKRRILRWMRWMRGSKDMHPELLAYEEQLKSRKKRFSMLRWWARKTP